MITDDQCISAYKKHEQLFAAADDLGMPWQTLYSRLRSAGVPVTGNKSRWGSKTDRFAALGEDVFKKIVPDAVDKNGSKFQSKVDFSVYGIPVDIKSSKPKRSSSKYPSERWAFYLKKQLEVAEFYVCFGFDAGEELSACYLIPRDMINDIGTLSIPCSRNSKWEAFSVDPSGLAEFFRSLSAVDE